MPGNNDLGDILTGLKEVSNSLNGVQQEFAGMKAQQQISDKSVKDLQNDVKELSTNFTKLDGKTKGLRADIVRVEKSLGEKIAELKTTDLRLIAKDEISQVVSCHEDRFQHKQKGSGSSGNIKKPSYIPSMNFDKVTIPKWTIIAGAFVGAALAGGGVAVYFLLF